jgi:hypothetical protein
MIEYYGWLKINLSLDGENEDNIGLFARKINLKLQEISTSSRSVEFKPLNGSYILHFAGSANHFGIDFEEIYSLCEYITKNAVGSYGIIYLQNDELPEPMNNQFFVYKIARGKISIVDDIYLSPCQYVIED